jgi:hypothetical protein
MPNHLSLISEDGQWKAELHAWKSNWLIYASIGSEVRLYHRQQTKNVWGQSTVEWVEAAGGFTINNTYKGGGYSISLSANFQDKSYGELKEWAWGLVKIDINIDTGGISEGPTTASLIIDSVEAHIGGVVGNFRFEGVVSADTAIVQQSTW